MTVTHPALSSRRARAGGFTLIEVMIVVAIVAILATIAIPSYRDYILRGELTQATTGLSSIQVQMERYFQDNRTYANVSSTVQTPCASNPRFGTFTITCDTGGNAPSATAFRLVATGSGSTNGFVFRVDHQMTRSSVLTSSAWGTQTCNTGWILKKGQACPT